MSLRDLAAQSKTTPSLLSKLREWLLQEGFTKCDSSQLKRVPSCIYKFFCENEVWMLEFSSTTLYVQLGGAEIQVATGSGDRHFSCGNDLEEITAKITATAKGIFPQAADDSEVEI